MTTKAQEKRCKKIQEATNEKYIGKVLNYLLINNVIRKQPYNQVYFVCKCLLCNSLTEKGVGAVLRNSTTSCGCRTDQYDKIRGKNSKQFTGYEEMSGKYWNTRKFKAKEKGLEFTITKEEAWKKFLQQNRKCALTGITLFFGTSPKTNNASLDRKDNLKGYTKDNIQWLHKDINVMKNMHDEEYFILLCHKVAQHNKMKEEFHDDSLFKTGRYTTCKIASSNTSHSK